MARPMICCGSCQGRVSKDHKAISGPAAVVHRVASQRADSRFRVTRARHVAWTAASLALLSRDGRWSRGHGERRDRRGSTGPAPASAHATLIRDRTTTLDPPLVPPLDPPIDPAPAAIGAEPGPPTRSRTAAMPMRDEEIIAPGCSSAWAGRSAPRRIASVPRAPRARAMAFAFIAALAIGIVVSGGPPRVRDPAPLHASAR